MAKRVSVAKRLADDMAAKRGIDALFEQAPTQQPATAPAEARKFEKATFYFDPDDLALLEKVWLTLMGEGTKCNKSEIVSILVRAGLEDHQQDPKKSLLAQRLTGQRRRG